MKTRVAEVKKKRLNVKLLELLIVEHFLLFICVWGEGGVEGVGGRGVGGRE